MERKLRLLEAIEGHTIVELCETGAALDEETTHRVAKNKNADISRELRRSASEGTRWYEQEEISSAPTVGLSAVVQNTRTSTPSSPPFDSQKRMRSAPEICTRFVFLQTEEGKSNWPHQALAGASPYCSPGTLM